MRLELLYSQCFHRNVFNARTITEHTIHYHDTYVGHFKSFVCGGSTEQSYIWQLKSYVWCFWHFCCCHEGASPLWCKLLFNYRSRTFLPPSKILLFFFSFCSEMSIIIGILFSFLSITLMTDLLQQVILKPNTNLFQQQLKILISRAVNRGELIINVIPYCICYSIWLMHA